MNDILKREINHAYIPQDVQAAIDTILSYAYTITLENQSSSAGAGICQSIHQRT